MFCLLQPAVGLLLKLNISNQSKIFAFAPRVSLLSSAFILSLEDCTKSVISSSSST